MTRDERLEVDGWGGIEPILFYKPSEEWGLFSNFSRHSVTLRNPWTGELQKYKTGEHRYQAMKATTEKDHDHVAKAQSAYDSKQRGGPRGIKLRPDWGDTYGSLCSRVMFEVVLAKTLQHLSVGDALAETTGALIYEDSPTDDIWGWRYMDDHRGKNLLGRALMDVRDLLF